MKTSMPSYATSSLFPAQPPVHNALQCPHWELIQALVSCWLRVPVNWRIVNCVTSYSLTVGVGWRWCEE